MLRWSNKKQNKKHFEWSCINFKWLNWLPDFVKGWMETTCVDSIWMERKRIFSDKWVASSTWHQKVHQLVESCHWKKNVFPFQIRTVLQVLISLEHISFFLKSWILSDTILWKRVWWCFHVIVESKVQKEDLVILTFKSVLWVLSAFARTLMSMKQCQYLESLSLHQRWSLLLEDFV